MNIALLMKNNIYHGREYMSALISYNLDFDVISIGQGTEDCNIEDVRTNYLWRPKSMKNMIDKVEHYYLFNSLNDPAFHNLMEVNNYDLGVQGGGLGVIQENVISKFNIGLLNMHPGDLPEYRGSSAPEWQLYEGREVVATCHLIDTGIDTGDILGKKKLALDYSDYYLMRAEIYPEMALYLAEVVQKIVADNSVSSLEKQNEKHAQYRSYIGDAAIEDLKEKMKLGIKFKP